MEKLGDKIRRRRKIMKLSQGRLAEGITSQTTVSRLENEDYEISLKNFILLMEKLNMSLHDVFCSGQKTEDHMIKNALDEARKNQDFDRMEDILESQSLIFWSRSPELKGYQYWHEGLVKQQNGDYKSALDLIDKAIEKNMANPLMYEAISEMYLAKGNIYSKMEINPIDAYKDAEAYYRLSDNRSYGLMVKILCNLAINYCRSNTYEKALKYSDEALNILQENESTYLICEVLYTKTVALISFNRIEEAEDFIMHSKYLFHTKQKQDMWEKLKSYSRENISG